jgi:hypothetical protein
MKTIQLKMYMKMHQRHRGKRFALPFAKSAITQGRQLGAHELHSPELVEAASGIPRHKALRDYFTIDDAPQ